MDNQEKVCPSCGEKIPKQAPNFCTNCGADLSAFHDSFIEKIRFLKPILLFWSRSFDFRGRSSREEYWWAVIFLVLVDILFLSVWPIDVDREYNDSFCNYLFCYISDENIFWCMWKLFTVIPSFNLFCRRLRDADILKDFLGFILLFLFLVPMAMKNFAIVLFFYQYVFIVCSIIACCKPSVVCEKE